MALSQLIQITFYQHKIEAIAYMLSGVAEALKVQSILGYCWSVGITNRVLTTRNSTRLKNKY